ncbi:hypothetical protein MtrunA17_Chr3g0139401 [Medicago truncatula]|uniref:Uncharacterized protein n=1 Tax=Medicago truncatula TaxID=3880 RepID=G7J2X5_MEDTR|nr:hypothetical protein MTR_3g109430 [Medicago truncatula]RHN70800.1 hypothetical protein MtrunA17_Chr3g0139401 [Medicago truncatula]
MDMKKYMFGSRREARLGRSYTTKTNYHSNISPSNYDGSKKTVWQKIWKKLKRDKKKVFNSPSPSTIVEDGVSYDQDTYSMNFDHGTGWMEPDNLPRSFSARYADPCWILTPKYLVGR